MIKTVEELRVKLEGKTEYKEIEAVLKEATIGAMKEYIEAEGYGICHAGNLRKADYVKELTSVIYSLVPEEKPESVADPKVMSFFKTILGSQIDAEKYVDVYASMSLYEKITATREPHKFSNLPEIEKRVMRGFEANYTYMGEERGMYGLFTNDLNTVNVTDTGKAAKYFEELMMRSYKRDYERATGHADSETTEEEKPTLTEASESAGETEKSETVTWSDLAGKLAYGMGVALKYGRKVLVAWYGNECEEWNGYKGAVYEYTTTDCTWEGEMKQIAESEGYFADNGHAIAWAMSV